MSRVDAAKVGAIKAVLPLKGTVSRQTRFSFPDGVEEIARVGSTAVIQPGGSGATRVMKLLTGWTGDDFYWSAALPALTCFHFPKLSDCKIPRYMSLFIFFMS